MLNDNTTLGLNLISDSFKDSLIFHIPHSKKEIPEEYLQDYVDIELLENEINLLTDFATDKIFNIDNTDKIIFPYNRTFCDVERLDDDNEIMFQYGRGYYYTKTDSGELLRGTKSKEIIYEKYYKKHHSLLSAMVKDKIENVGFATIIDCHSFSNIPFNTDLEKLKIRPDFCLGTDKIHSPEWLWKPLYDFLTEKGFSVEINYPYSGTIIPLEYYNKKNIFSIMIEVNRKLYMDNGIIDEEKVKYFNSLFSEIIMNFNIVHDGYTI